MIIFEFDIHPEWCDEGSDFAKALSFVSEHLTYFEMKESMVRLHMSDHDDTEASRNNFMRLIDQFKKNGSRLCERQLYEYQGNGKMFGDTDILTSDLVRSYGDGLIGLQGVALKLIEYFDRTFSGFAIKLGAEEKQYPVLLPIEVMEKTGYLRTSPQYSMFVSNVREDMDCLSQLALSVREGCTIGHFASSGYVLSPAACFHCYMDLEGQEIGQSQVLTLRQHVFRHEGSLNWNQYGRLRDYQVREVVFIGSREFVSVNRERLIEYSKRWIEELGLTARYTITNDSFVIPEMQKFKKIQLMEQSKIELQLAIDHQHYMACASFNLHGKAFSEPFGFRVNGEDETVTGCVGFGLERWVLAFLSQYGTDISNWPLEIQDAVAVI